VGGDEVPNGSAPGTTRSALTVGINACETLPLSALPASVDRSHVGADVRVLAATLIGPPGRQPLAVLAVTRKPALALVEVLGPLDHRAGRASLEFEPRGVTRPDTVLLHLRGSSRVAWPLAQPRTAPGPLHADGERTGRTPDVNGVVNGTCQHPLRRGGTGQHEQRASRWSDGTERTGKPYLGPFTSGFKTGVSSSPAQAGSIPVRLRSDFVRWSFRLYLAPGYGSSPSC
jgi:hypothetical protein